MLFGMDLMGCEDDVAEENCAMATGGGVSFSSEDDKNCCGEEESEERMVC